MADKHLDAGFVDVETICPRCGEIHIATFLDPLVAQLAALQERVRVLEAALRDMLYQYGDNDNTAVEAAEKALAGTEPAKG